MNVFSLENLVRANLSALLISASGTSCRSKARRTIPRWFLQSKTKAHSVFNLRFWSILWRALSCRKTVGYSVRLFWRHCDGHTSGIFWRYGSVAVTRAYKWSIYLKQQSSTMPSVFVCFLWKCKKTTVKEILRDTVPTVICPKVASLSFLEVITIKCFYRASAYWRVIFTREEFLDSVRNTLVLCSNGYTYHRTVIVFPHRGCEIPVGMK